MTGRRKPSGAIFAAAFDLPMQTKENATMSDAARTKNRSVTEEQYLAEGKRRFGEDMLDWRFVCPCCGHEACARDWLDAGAPQSAVAYSCVGRWLGSAPAREAFGEGGPGPCNYAGGGLLTVGPISVLRGGQYVRYFDFAPVAGVEPWADVVAGLEKR